VSYPPGELRHNTTDNTIANIKGKGAGNGSLSHADSSVGPAGSAFTPSTNLAEVSDWLPKLLLNAGLVQLTRFGGRSGTLIMLAAGLGDVGALPAQVMAGAIMVTYVIIGFLDGYVVTTRCGRKTDGSYGFRVSLCRWSGKIFIKIMHRERNSWAPFL
jgi:hypothetical protein